MTATLHAVQGYVFVVAVFYSAVIGLATAMLSAYIVKDIADGALWRLVPGVTRFRYAPRHAAWLEPDDDYGTAWLVGMGEAATP